MCTGRRDITEILLKTMLNTIQSINNTIIDHKVNRSFHIQKIDHWRKVSIQVSLRELRRLTRIDTFCKCIYTPPLFFTGSYISLSEGKTTIHNVFGWWVVKTQNCLKMARIISHTCYHEKIIIHKPSKFQRFLSQKNQLFDDLKLSKCLVIHVTGNYL